MRRTTVPVPPAPRPTGTRRSGNRAWFCCSASASASIRSSLRCRGFNRSQSRRFSLRLRPARLAASAGRPVCGRRLFASSRLSNHEVNIGRSRIRSAAFRPTFSIRFSIDMLPILHHAGHPHRARLIHQAAIFVVHIGEKNHLEQPALVFQRHKHHVAVILRAHVPVGHHPAAQRDSLPVHLRQFIAPGLSIPRAENPADGRSRTLPEFPARSATSAPACNPPCGFPQRQPDRVVLLHLRKKHVTGPAAIPPRCCARAHKRRLRAVSFRLPRCLRQHRGSSSRHLCFFP